MSSLHPLLAPRSIAIIGASNDPKRIGGIPLELLIRAGFQRVYPVNPRYPEIQGLKAYPDIESVPEAVDLAILAISAGDALSQLERCHARGVKAAVVFASGYSEEGTEEGERRQEELTAFARRTGMPVAGPNCMGNAHFRDGIFTTFGTSFQPGDTPGSTALVTQSGNMCATIYRIARRFGVNFNHVINTGNEASVELTDYLAFLADDPGTDSALCYVEGVRDGEAFFAAGEAFRRQGKLLALYKVGASEKGAAATQSHTAALAGDRHAYEAALKRVGAVAAGSLAELADVAYLHRFRERRIGKGVAVLSISGAAGAIMADALSAAGAEMPSLPPHLQARLEAAIPGHSMVSNPIDLTGNIANDNQFLLNVMSTVAEADQIDVIVLYLPGHFLTRAMEQVAAFAAGTDKAVVVIDTFALADRAAVEAAGCALFDDFDRAAGAIGKYAAWREGLGAPTRARATRPQGKVWPAADFHGQALTEVEAKAELARFGVPVASGKLVHSEAEARIAANAIGGQLVLKLVSPDVQHKSEHGFVQLQVDGPEAAARIYRDMIARAGEMNGVRIEGVTVEPQLTGGVELLVGCTRDPAFGWLMTVGLGGVFTEVMADVSHRLLPVDAQDAESMLRDLKGFRLLTGYRGAPPADVAAAAKAIAALSDAVLAAGARVREVEINPLIVLPAGRGAFAADGLVLLDAPADAAAAEAEKVPA
jgi:acyl-CoA synthetase (NDP forming)